MTTLLRSIRLSTVALLIAFIGVATLWLLVRPESAPTPRTVVGVITTPTLTSSETSGDSPSPSNGLSESSTVDRASPTTGTVPTPTSTTPATAAPPTPTVPATSARPTRSPAVSVTPTVASSATRPSTTAAGP